MSALYSNALIPLELKVTGMDGIPKKIVIAPHGSVTLSRVDSIEICTRGHGCNSTKIAIGYGYQIEGDLTTKRWHITCRLLKEYDYASPAPDAPVAR
jgi:hypothetical protein